MATSITVRDVPVKVHRELSARAARRGQSLQAYLKAELARLVSQPSQEEVWDRIRARKAATDVHLEREWIVAAKDADRK